MAYALARFQESRELDETGLAEYLGCGPEALTGLALCLRPTGLHPGFREQVEAMAREVPINRSRLVNLLREVDLLSEASGASGVALRAARDRGFGDVAVGEAMAPEENEATGPGESAEQT